MIDVTDFRNGMSMLGGAVSVITTADCQGLYGMTASAVCSVTDNPPTLLVCINRNAWSHDRFIESGKLCVNVLAAGQQELSGRFASKHITMTDRFTSRDWSTLKTGAPVLINALVNFDCNISHTHEVGSHTVFFAEIQAVRLGESNDGLVYFNRHYHELPHRVQQDLPPA